MCIIAENQVRGNTYKSNFYRFVRCGSISTKYVFRFIEPEEDLTSLVDFDCQKFSRIILNFISFILVLIEDRRFDVSSTMLMEDFFTQKS